MVVNMRAAFVKWGKGQMASGKGANFEGQNGNGGDEENLLDSNYFQTVLLEYL
jgi:hypothetical protein